MLSFRSFDVEISTDCDKDYVEIREGNSIGNLIGVYCGNSVPNNITASAKFWVKFRSDENGTGLGFVADYSLLHGNEMSGPQGQIASPLYPYPFTTTGTYTWRITVDFGMVVSITLEDFYVDSLHENCVFFFKLFDGYDDSAPVLFEDCAYNKPPPLTSSSNVVYIVWNVRYIRLGSWFLLNWLQVPRVTTPTVISTNTSTSSPGCGGLINVGMNSTQFTSPGYPHGYLRNLNCEWIFETAPYNHVAISVTDMNLQASPYCTISDNLQIYNGLGSHQEWELVKTYCLPNASREDPIHGSSIMKAVFRTNAYRNGTGFSAVAASKCGGALKGPNGIIDAQNLNLSGPPVQIWVTCQWNISVKAGRTIVVEFDSFDITTTDTHCGDNYILFRNGGSVSSPYLGNGKYCGTQSPEVPETIGNQMFIKYNAMVGTKGFKLRYREKSASCGGHVLLSSDTTSSEISSPNFPNIPPPHIECEWTFLAPAGERISLDFLERFDLTPTKGCSKSYVEIRNGGTQNSELIGKFCHEMPGTQSSTGNILYVKFFTDEEEPRNGFKAKASVATCGGTIRAYRGSIKSPNYPAPYPQNSVCKWIIVGSSFHAVNLSFSKIDLPENSNCSNTDHVIISETAYTFPNALQSTPTVSSNSQMLTSTMDSRFVAEDDYYEESEEENENVPAPNTREVQKKRRILAVICGSGPILPIESSTNELEVKFVSKRNSQNFKGFHLTFETSMKSCGSRLDGMPNGIIESPGYPNGILHMRICAWQITVPRGRRIRVEFQDLDLAGNPHNCIHRLAFFQGNYVSVLIRSFCGTHNPEPIESTTNSMVVYFLAKHSSNHRGFRATYSSDLATVCDGDLSSSSGVITSPRSVNLTSFYCDWERQENATLNYTLSFTLLNSQIGERALGNCRYYPTSLIITDGSETLDEFCGNYTSPKIVASPYPLTRVMARQGAKRGDRGGLNNFTLQYSVSRCGGILGGPHEEITSPNFPQEYPPNVNCVWALNYPEGQQIKLKFVNMSLESNCLNDYLEVRNGGSPKSPLIGSYCGNNNPEDIQSQSNKLWIFFHSNIIIQAGGFKMITEPIIGGCGGIMYGNTGEISSPNYPKQYDNNVECLWEITVEQGYHIGLTFVDRFQLEGSGSCSKDFVEVFNFVNETWVSLGKVCGRNLHVPFNSTGNRMKVLFRSNNSTKGDGFKAQWSVNCGGVTNSMRGVLTSPGYPEFYGNNLLCDYTISVPGEYIIAEFQYFNLEKEPTCNYDNLTIFTIENRGQSPRQFGPYCGTDKPPVIRAISNIRLVFKTDAWVKGTGFFMKYRVETCGGYVNSPQIISSPTHENVYFGGLNCTWVIQAPANQVAVLIFESFILEKSGTCSYDHVSVYDAAYINPKKRLAIFCGNLNSDLPVMTSTNRSMVVQFATDTSVQHEGFRASISFTYGESSGCGGTKTVPSDGPLRLSSPRVTQNNHYEPFLDCHWLLLGTPQKMLVVEFKSMDLIPCPLPSNTQCGCDFIEIRDGAGPFSELIGRYCGSSDTPRITSSSNQLWIRFKTDGFGNGQGFQLDITNLPSPCGSELSLKVTNTTKVLQSPNYPNNYPNNLRCHWKLTADEPGYRFDIHFKDMDIEDSESCVNDWLEIYDSGFSGVITEGYGEQFVHRGKFEVGFNSMSLRVPWLRSKFCGVGHPSDFYSGTNEVEIAFMTNSANTSKGFQLEYQLEGCNRNFTREQGRILNSKGGPEKDCLVTIQAKPNHTISLYFNDFQMIRSDESLISEMEVRDGLSSDSPLLGRFSGHMIPNPIFSTSSTISIRVRYSSRWPTERYDITYVTTDKGRGCGGRIFNYGGRFTSPLYPMNVRNETNCRWEIMVPEGLFVSLRPLNFDMGARSNCDTDYVNIFDVDKVTKNEILRTKLCGTDNVAEVLAASNVVVVQSITSFNNAGAGWVILFNAARTASIVP